MPRPLLLFLGDSLTEQGAKCDADGFVCLLLDRFTRSADVSQRGLGGYTTQLFLDFVIATLIIDLIMTLQPALIALWLGANDAALPDGPSYKQHVPLARYRRNLHAMVQKFKANSPNSKLLLITPPAVDDARRRQPSSAKQDRSNAATGEYARICVEVARAEEVAVLDVWTIFNSFSERERNAMLSDGLHLSRAGNRLVERLIVSTIQSKLPVLYRQLNRWDFPPFQELEDHQPADETEDGEDHSERVCAVAVDGYESDSWWTRVFG